MNQEYLHSNLWSPVDKADSIRLQDDGLEVESMCDHESLIRTTTPISPRLNHFKIRILHGGKDNNIWFGFTNKYVNNTICLPGFDANSLGYGSNNGKIYQSGEEYATGESFTTNATIGLHVDFVRRKCTFTKNGKVVGVPIDTSDLKEDLYPTVGFKSKGAKVKAMPFESQIINTPRGIFNLSLHFLGGIYLYSVL